MTDQNPITDEFDCIVVFETALHKNGRVEHARVEVESFAKAIHGSRNARAAAANVARLSFDELAKAHNATFDPKKIKAIDVIPLTDPEGH